MVNLCFSQCWLSVITLDPHRACLCASSPSPEVAGLESVKRLMQTTVASLMFLPFSVLREVLSEAALCGPRLWESLLQSCCISPGQSQRASGGQEMG